MNLDDDDFDTVDELPAGPHRKLSDADLELLQLAARALGAVQVDEVDGEDWLILHFADGTIEHGWNPLIHSDNAFTLASKLGLLVDFSFKSAMNSKRSDVGIADWNDGDGDDPVEATRHAIALAAAKMGKAI